MGVNDRQRRDAPVRSRAPRTAGIGAQGSLNAQAAPSVADGPPDRRKNAGVVPCLFGCGQSRALAPGPERDETRESKLRATVLGCSFLRSMEAGRCMKSAPGPPMTLGNAAAAHVADRVVQGVRPPGRARCRRDGPAIWRRDQRLVCSRCGSRAIDMVVTGTERHQVP
jgi:hypothetical protein